MSKPKVAVFRPDDDRITAATEYLKDMGATPVADPMLTIHPTGKHPRKADYSIFTSKAGVVLAADQEWNPAGTTVCAIGERTAIALREQGYPVDITPSTATSSGLVTELADVVDGRTVEIARSAHGSDELIDGLEEAGAIVHETDLYRLQRPESAGRSVKLAAERKLDGVLFTSPKTVEHFFEIADEHDSVASVRHALEEIVVGAIGPPTKRTVGTVGVNVDVMPKDIGYTQLARAVVNAIQNNWSKS